MEDYAKLIDLICQCELELKGHKSDKTFAPSCSIDDIAFYLYKHGVKTEKGDNANG